MCFYLWIYYVASTLKQNCRWWIHSSKKTRLDMLTWSTSFSSCLFLAAGLLFLFSLDFLCCCALLEETLCGKLAWVARKTRGRRGYRGAVAFLFGAHLAQIGTKRPVADSGNRKRNCQYTKLSKNRKAVGLGDIMAGRRLGESLMSPGKSFLYEYCQLSLHISSFYAPTQNNRLNEFLPITTVAE